MENKQITQMVKENQVTIVNGYTYGRIPIDLARDYRKIVVATSETFIYHKAKLVSDEVKDVTYLTSVVSRLKKHYHVAFIAYGSNVLIREIRNNRYSESFVLIVDDSINCVNADTIINFVRYLITEGAKLKLVIINKVAKYGDKLSKAFNNAPVINWMPKTDLVSCEFHAAKELENMIFYFYKQAYQNILVIVPGEQEIQSIKDKLKLSLLCPLVHTISSGFTNYGYLKRLNKKIILATGNVESIISLLDFKFDIVIDTGLEKRWKVINGLETLITRYASKNTLEQRKSLAERYCLCSDYEYNCRKQVDVVIEPSLDKMLLALGIDPKSMPLLFTKSSYAVSSILHSLWLTGCIDDSNKITALGEKVLVLSLPVRFAKMFVEASWHHLEGDVLILYYIAYNRMPKSFDKDSELNSDLFQLFYQIKQLYLQDKSKFREKFPRLQKLFEWFSVVPYTTDIPTMKKLIASAFPDCLFILTSKTGYKRDANSKFSYTTLARSSLVRGENKYLVGFFPSINRSKKNIYGVLENRGIITLPTVYSQEEVLEYFEPFLNNNIYNGLKL